MEGRGNGAGRIRSLLICNPRQKPARLRIHKYHLLMVDILKPRLRMHTVVRTANSVLVNMVVRYHPCQNILDQQLTLPVDTGRELSAFVLTKRVSP